MSEVIDLDALAPPSVTIKFNGQDIAIDPPKTGDILRLGFLGQKLQKADKLPPEELDALVVELTEQVKRCVPALAGAELASGQLMKLVEILGEMATPPDAKEMQKRGMSAADPKDQ